MNSVRAFAGSTVGRKAVMAVSGIILVGFVIGHVLGNLLVFKGPEAMNEYAAFLKGNAALLWGTRAVVFLAVVGHVWAATTLTVRQRAARPVAYAKRDPQVTTFAARTIRVGGFLLLLFIVLHILHFTTGTIRPAPFSVHNVYGNVILNFRIWWVTLFYVVAMIFLGLHLYHGGWSSPRSLGISPPAPNPLHRRFALGLGVVLWLAFTSVPVAVFLGVIQ